MTMPVSAHVLITSGSIGATLHIDPDDDPFAKAVSTFYLEFKDLNSKFALSKCRCQVFIFQDDKELYFEALRAVNVSSPLSSVFKYEFPATGTYRMEIKGDPIQAGAFESFTLKEVLAVEREQTGEDKPKAGQSVLETRWPQFLMVGVVVALLVGGFKLRSRPSRA